MHKINVTGDSNKHYHIHLPNEQSEPDGENSTVLAGMKGLYVLGYYSKNVTVDYDHPELHKRHPPIVKVMSNNGSICNFFLVNDSLFMMVDCDCPMRNAHKWVPHYAKYCTAFFVLNSSEERDFIFKDLSIPVYQLPHYLGRGTHVVEMEIQGRSHKLSCEQDIPVFFIGSHGNRIARSKWGHYVCKEFPKSVYHDSRWVRDFGYADPHGYFDKLCRAKIVWCPRSSKCRPNHEENLLTGRVIEAMCVESFVLAHESHTRTTEPIIDGIHYAKVQNDNSDLIEKIHYYLEHDDERKEIAHNGRLWFERNCSAPARAYYIINRCMEAMGEGAWNVAQCIV